MECPICYSLYTAEANLPLVFPCGHSFCKQCVEALKPHGAERICPSCRKPLPFSTLADVPVNYSILDQVAKATDRSKDDEEVCEIHQTKKVKFFCEPCGKTFCTKCVVMHSGPTHQLQPAALQMDSTVQRLSTQLARDRVSLQEQIASVSANKERLQAQLEVVTSCYEQLLAQLMKEREQRTSEVKAILEQVNKSEEELKGKEQRLRKLAESLTQLQHSQSTIKEKKQQVEAASSELEKSIESHIPVRLRIAAMQPQGFVTVTPVPQRRPRKEEVDVSVLEAVKPEVPSRGVWQYRNNLGFWANYPPEGSEEVERALKAGKKSVIVGRFRVDLENYTQTNTITGYYRSIRRVAL